MVEDDVLIRGLRLLPARGTLNGILPVQIVKNACKEGQGAGEIHLNVQEGFHRPVETVDQGDSGCHHTNSQGRIQLPDDQDAPRKIDKQGAYLGKHAHQDEKQAAACRLPEREPGRLPIYLYKPVVFFFLSGKQFHQKRAAHGQGLIDDLIHLILLCLTFGQQAVAPAPGAPRRQDQERDDRDSGQGQLWTHGKHGDQRCHHRRRVAHQGGERTADHRAHPADIRVHPRDDIPLLFRREKGVGHIFQMPVHLIFHIKK